MLARSLHVSHTNNNRFAVVVCFNSAIRASEIREKMKNFVPSS